MHTALRGPNKARRASARNRGTVLIVSMWIVLVLAGLVLAFTRTARVEAIEAANQVAATQAEAIAQGALQYVLANVEEANGDPTTLTDLPCQQVQVGDGYFWLLEPRPTDGQTYSFGIEDEASKLNLNTGTVDMLSLLPDMTAELAASIVDWRTADTTVSTNGAKDAYYLSLPEPYHCKNAPLETLEEVLLIKGGSPDLLYAGDTNRNGIIDPGENGQLNGLMNGSLDFGFAEYATVCSSEPNTTAEGQPRVNVNNQNMQALSTVLTNALGSGRALAIMARARRGRPFRNVLDFGRRTGMTTNELALVADELTTVSQRTLTGLVNVNTAPREVLLCLPGIDEGNVDALLAARSGETGDFSSIAWVAGVLSMSGATQVGSYITVRSYQYSADIVSISGNGRAYKRYRAVVDARQSPAQVIYWKDLTDLGWPLWPEVPALLRRGQPLPQTSVYLSAR